MSRKTVGNSQIEVSERLAQDCSESIEAKQDIQESDPQDDPEGEDRLDQIYL